MPPFKEWLAEKAAQKLDSTERQARVQEWTTSVEDLVAQMGHWLAEDDPHRVFSLETPSSAKQKRG